MHMHALPTRIARTAVLVAGLMAGSLAHANIANGNFSAGLSGWQTFGDAAALSSSPASLALPIGNSTLVLGTASLGSDDYPQASGHYNVSGQDVGAIGTSGGLEDFVGAAIGSLHPDPINFTSILWEGSAARQSFTVQAGDTLSFTWNLLSTDRDFADRAFVVIDAHTANGLQVLALGDAAQATNAVSGNGQLLQTGSQIFSHTFTTAGTVTLSLAVADLDAPDQTSLLTVNDVALTAAVPEPSTAVFALLGLAAGGLFMRRRQG
ncbi:MAG: PEP-CTERM sorting domain-containing protein [Aquabacterium sp.]